MNADDNAVARQPAPHRLTPKRATAWRTILVPIAWIALFAFLPLYAGKFEMQLATRIVIFAILAMSLNLLVGVTGLVSLGHAAFYGTAAYVLARTSPQYEAVSILTSLPLAVAAAALLALVIGALSLRTSGVYFIMVTLAFGEMVYSVVHDTPLGGGSDGIYLYVKPVLAIAGTTLVDLDKPAQFYWFSLVAATLVYAFLRRLLRSPFGRALAGIRVNEHRMRAVGYGTYFYKLAAFTLAGALAGIAGYLNASQFGFVNPELLSWHTSGIVLMMVIVGGSSRLSGAVLGAAVFVLLQEFFSDEGMIGATAKHWQLLLGMTIVAVVLFAPRGLGALFERLPMFGRRGKANGDA